MSSSRAIKPKRDETLLSNWESTPERAPSLTREDQPVFARIVALVGLFFLVLGTLAMLAPGLQRATIIRPEIGFVFATLGVCAILFHAFVERDIQFRRLYGFLGLALVLAGIVLRLMAFKAGFMGHFVIYGFPALFLGLVVSVAVIRNETDAHFRLLLLNFVGGVGAVIILFSVLFGLRSMDFLPGEGAVLLLLGLLYAGTYIGQQETASKNGYYAALALGGVGLFGIVASVITMLVMPEANFLIPNGLILIGMSIVYLAVSVGVCCDWPIVVLTRRDLAAYFYSPIAYLVLVGLLLIACFMFAFFAAILEGGMLEPIIRGYIWELFPVIVQIFLIPVLTMRLFSEEHRTGTLEVLLTAPVNEITVVAAKFLACWIFYMLTWLPFWVFLVSLRYLGREEFDYRPILSFMVAAACINAGLLSMGLFFSSMTSNQIIAAVLTFVGVLAHVAFLWVQSMPGIARGGVIQDVLSFVNFLDYWNSALEGSVSPRLMVFHLSVAIFFLFATVKILESRKWN